MFYYQEIKSSPCVPCSKEDFERVVNDGHVRAIIDQVRAKFDAGDEDGANERKRSLPMFLFMAGGMNETPSTMEHNRGTVGAWRKKEATVLNGLVMLDFDHIAKDVAEASDIFYKKVKPQAEGIGLMLAHITPKYGLRLVCKADLSGDIAQNQEAIAKTLGLENDQACKDPSRTSFAVTKDDILFINNEIFDYDNHEYDKKFGPDYRAGNSTSAANHHVCAPAASGSAAGTAGKTDLKGHEEASGAAGEREPLNIEKNEKGEYCFCGVPYSEIQEEYWRQQGGRPAVGTRHTSVLALAGRLRYICDNNADVLYRVIDHCGLPEAELKGICDAAVNKPMAPYVPKTIRAFVEAVFQQRGLETPFGSKGDAALGSGGESAAAAEVDYAYWWQRLKPLLCAGLDDAVEALPEEIKIGGAMAACAMFGTYLTRCSFLHGDGEQRRLSFLVYIIGLPASGKSFLPVLDRLIMEPMKVADEMGRLQEQQYKEDLKKRESSSKNQKDAARDVPHPVIRYVPSSISNAMLYTRLRDAKETVNGEEIHLHLYTCEAELSAALRAQTGSWAGKLDLECKSFQNEECGVDFKNLESANGIYQVNWNQCISGTPDALRRKFRLNNALDGLTTRIAIFEMPVKRYVVNRLRTAKARDFDLEGRLRSWGYHLDKLHGELICPKLVEEAWAWLEEVSREAEENDDIVTDFFDTRITLYFVRYGIVHNVLRDIRYLEHLQNEGKPLKLRINKQDIEFGRLMADFILMMQVRMFGEQTWNALENEKQEFKPRERKSRYEELYKLLPATFDAAKVSEVFGVKKTAAAQHLQRLEKRNYIKRIKTGVYKKIVY